MTSGISYEGMLPKCVENAMALLANKTSGQLDREVVSSLACLDALAHYYPSLVTAPLLSLKNKFEWVRQKENSRLIKQRRIALVYILREVQDLALHWGGGGMVKLGQKRKNGWSHEPGAVF
ncbi:MAG: hypothetical protein A2583_09350 [Bdellovibrionales bacterium RIFOXYD1_FULL_53_11]|nr:MAG: hypothetical protein A2583_09350 [Bdellovibrionales bacterium RIFOXYD1_FULL_53_11]